MPRAYEDQVKKDELEMEFPEQPGDFVSVRTNAGGSAFHNEATPRRIERIKWEMWEDHLYKLKHPQRNSTREIDLTIWGITLYIGARM